MNNFKKILLIDDEQGMQDLFRFLLEPQGYRVFTASNGQEGVDLVKNNKYDIIFLDVHMPVMGGPEALKKIKEIRPDQTVIIFSSSSDPAFSFETRARELGAHTCLYKPVDIDTIQQLIESITKKK
ncbi:MAG TPA: response regulator [Spirochaetia bacterium]|nr:response regulator [Spirochaetia bacterium]